MKQSRMMALATTALGSAAFAATALAAPVLPTGGKVVAGSASIGAPSGGSLVVNQSSGKAIINWSGFSIGQGGRVQFDNGSGATLNRVTGGSVSSLDGLLSATGSVYLINPNGVIVGKSGVVNVGGTFVASTLDASNAGFLAGRPLSFTGPSTAAVVNYGKIGSLGGDVALIAATVNNAGSITAAKGDVGLLAGSSVVLKDASLDDGRFSVLLGGAGTSATNSGLIQAADAELRAEGGNVYALAGDTAGVIRATGVKSGGGHVWLVADRGTLDLAGTVEAQAQGGAAGSVETSGATVDVGAASIDAHGGTWTVDPTDLTIDAAAATTIDNSLNAGTSVTEQTTATGSSGAGVANPNGVGDIVVAAPISWNTTAGLTLSAYRNIDVEANVTAAQGGALTLVTDNSGAGNGGALQFYGGAIQFTGLNAGQPTGSLSIGVGTASPTRYVLVADLATLAADITANNSGAFALATSVDGSNSGAGYPESPLAAGPMAIGGNGNNGFQGVLEGLGNSVVGLSVTSGVSGFEAFPIGAGLFAQLGSNAVVRDLTLDGGSVVSTNKGAAGGLAGSNFGAVLNVTSSVSVTSDGVAGGLVGDNEGSIAASSASGAVSSYTGATVYDALYTPIGGLVGGNGDGGGTGTITRSYATGAVTGLAPDNAAGGLIGVNGGSASNVYATGAVGIASGVAGGLIGANGLAFAEGSFTGAVSFGYATGAVHVGSGGAGGLVGLNYGSTIADAIASGAVSGGAGSHTGGLVGVASGGSIVASYYDAGTTGQSVGEGSVDPSTTYDVTAVGGSTGLAATSAASYGELSFGTTPGAPGFAIVDANGTLNNAGGASGATRPLLLSEAGPAIGNAHQLQLMALDPTASYVLTADIDASGTAFGDVWASGFAPVGGNAAAVFSGTFNGAGHTISGLTINDTTNAYTGLFGQVSGTVTNLSLDGGVFGQNTTGLLAGQVSGVVSGVTASGSVANGVQAAAGGLIGELAQSGAVSHSNADVSVNASGVGGGLVGVVSGAGATISNSYASGAVYSFGDAGGLVAINGGAISNSYATGSVTVATEAAVVGGLGGENLGQITTSYATGAVGGVEPGAGSAFGGLVGQNGGDSSDLTSLGFGGGSSARVSGTISLSYATGTVTSDGTSLYSDGVPLSTAGGLVGTNLAGSISDSYAVGAVTTVANSGDLEGGYSGGLVGLNDGTIARVWASGAVSNALLSPVTGGLLGSNNDPNTGGVGTIAAGYYDQGTTGQASGLGDQTDAASGVTAVGGATGLSPYSASSYPGLQFGATPGGASGQTWVIVDATSSLNNANGDAGGTRPFLLSEYSTAVANSHQLQLLDLVIGAPSEGLTYTLASDIDLTATGASKTATSSDMWAATGFVPIGAEIFNSNAAFRADFEGGGHTLSNLYINNDAMVGVGLFGGLGNNIYNGEGGGGSAEDLALVNVDVTGLHDVGALAGQAGGDVTNVQVSGQVRDTGASGTSVGGLIGYSENVFTRDSLSSAAVSGGNSATVGGLVGYAFGLIINAQATGVVTGGDGAIVGGVAGNATDLLVVSSSATVSGGANATVGGIIGVGGGINSSYATGAVSGGAGSTLGGAAGSLTFAAADTYATGAVTATGGGATAGGFAGAVQSGATVNGGYALGAVTVAGSNGTGTLGIAGGFAGTNAGTISHVYATGKVSGGGDGLNTLAGLVATNTGSVSQGFWDLQTTGQSLDGAVSVDPATGSTGLTTAQFMDPTSPISGLGLGATPSSSGGGGPFVIVDVDGSFNGAGGAAGATRPFLVAEAPAFQSPLAGYASVHTVENAHQLQLVGLAPGLTYIAETSTGDKIDASATADTDPSDMWGAAGFVPIGSGATPFMGTFIGGQISGLTVNKAGGYAGLFGAVGPTGQVEYVSLTDASISGGGYVGGLVGDNSGNLSGASFQGVVSGPGGVGGLVGVNEGGGVITGASAIAAVTGTADDVGGIAGANFGAIDLASQTVTTTVSGHDHVGGLVGYNAGPLSNATAAVSVSGADYVGGAVGVNYAPLSTVTISGVGYDPAAGAPPTAVSGAEYVGGLIGWNTSYGSLSYGRFAPGAYGYVQGSGDYVGGLAGVNAGTVTGSTANVGVGGKNLVGGLVGLNRGVLQSSSADASVGGELYVGGVAGWNDTGATISATFDSDPAFLSQPQAQPTVQAAGTDSGGNSYVGGLVGVNYGAISNSYATVNVSGVQVVGGLVGTNMPGGASVTTSYATGAVTASAGAAGLTFGVQAGEVSYVYGFPSLSGQPVEAGYTTPNATGAPTDLTAAQEDGSAAYQGFDFTNTWQSNPDGPPTLPAPQSPAAN